MTYVREDSVEGYLIREVKTAGGEVRKVAWPGRRHAPDRLVLLPGAHYLAELKAPGKQATAGQRREHERLKAAGFDVRVLDTRAKIYHFIREVRP